MGASLEEVAHGDLDSFSGDELSDESRNELI